MALLESPIRVFKGPKRHEGFVTSGGPDAGYRAYEILYALYVILPIAAGLDKFFNVLTDWQIYIAPAFAGTLGQGFMQLVGVVEICAGLLVAFAPRTGGKVLAGWLGLIVLNLLMAGYLDIAARDAGLALGAVCLALLAREYRVGAGATRLP